MTAINIVHLPIVESHTAAELKAEADAIYKAGDYTGAYAKYSRAILKDEKNPILYSNRAACSMMLKQCVYSALFTMTISPAAPYSYQAAAEDCLVVFSTLEIHRSR